MTVDPKHVVEVGYDRIAQRHAQWAGGIRTEERNRYLEAFCERVPEGSCVLELGCGAGGHVTNALASRFRLTAVDISLRSIEQARQANPGAEFLHRDMTELDFAPETYAGVAAFYSIIHIPREEQGPLLVRIGRWLCPGGVFVGAFGVIDVSEAIEEEWLGTRMFWSSYDAETGRGLVETAGFKIDHAAVETEDEDGQPASFLWVVAQKLQSPAALGSGVR